MTSFKKGDRVRVVRTGSQVGAGRTAMEGEVGTLTSWASASERWQLLTETGEYVGWAKAEDLAPLDDPAADREDLRALLAECLRQTASLPGWLVESILAVLPPREVTLVRRVTISVPYGTPEVDITPEGTDAVLAGVPSLVKVLKDSGWAIEP